MIPNRIRENRRTKFLKPSRNIERLYKEGKCRECAVVVTKMNFAKILGKFTKVKIQYESSSPKQKSKSKQNESSPNSNARLKSNENGMVLIHRNAYNQHPVKEIGLKKSKPSEVSTPRPINNVLKENNRLKKATVTDQNSNYNNMNHIKIKLYGIVFIDPITKSDNDVRSKITLLDLLPQINENILPCNDWHIDFHPINSEPKDDKVYDRIAAELEDLMYNEKPPASKTEVTASKADEFPSIMDILNDSSSMTKKSEDQVNSSESNIESSDVEAMLLGKPESTPMEVDNEVSDLIKDVEQLNETQNNIEQSNKLPEPVMDEIENPQSPSILDEALQKGIEEHLPTVTPKTNSPNNEDTCVVSVEANTTKVTIISKTEHEASKREILPRTDITEVIFKKTKNGVCFKSVTCPKNLKYSIQIDAKSIELLGAPKFISSIDDLQVLLQIVNESDLDSLHVLH